MSDEWSGEWIQQDFGEVISTINEGEFRYWTVIDTKHGRRLLGSNYPPFEPGPEMENLKAENARLREALEELLGIKELREDFTTEKALAAWRKGMDALKEDYQ